MPVRNATMRSPFTDAAEAPQQQAELAILRGRVARSRGRVARSPFGGTTPVSDTEAAVIAGRVARSPFTGQPVQVPEAKPLKRTHNPVTDDPRRRENTR